MTAKTLISPIEHKLLLNFVLLICFVYFYNLSDKAIYRYNDEVARSEQMKEEKANNPKPSKISFGIYDNCSGTPIWFLFYGLQFLTTPLSYFLLRIQRLRRFVTSSIFTFLTLLSFLAWTYETFLFARFIEGNSKLNESFNQHILFDSTFLEFILSILIALFLFLQISILVRFVVEKFQAKISLK